MVTPTGGPKDEHPPSAVVFEPSNAIPGFRSDQVRITFDEIIELSAPQQIIISPLLKPAPLFRVKGKTLVIGLNPDSLLPNTTYTIHLGEAVRDVTEGNIARDLDYVFSTGEYVDSLFLSGAVRNAFSREAEKGVAVMLYECADSVPKSACDSMPFREAPRYFAMTRADGSFSIRNIRAGEYFLFALKDLNRNFLYDLPNEMIGFAESPVMVPDTQPLKCYLFAEKKYRQFIKDVSSPRYGMVTIIFNEPVKEVRLRVMHHGSSAAERGKRAWEILEYSPGRDTLTFWTTLGQDTLEAEVTEHVSKNPDSILFSDTFRIRMNRGLPPPALSLTGGGMEVPQPFVLTCAHPVLISHTENITVTESPDDTLPGDTLVATPWASSDPAMRRYSFAYPWKEGYTYRIKIPPGSFKDIFGLTNDSALFTFRAKEESEYGKLLLRKTGGGTAGCFLQLLDAAGGVAVQMPCTEERVRFTYLNPGEYRLRLIEDSNGNGAWDTGDYSARRQPEPVRYYPTKITIRANWDLELEWRVEPSSP